MNTDDKTLSAGGERSAEDARSAVGPLDGTQHEAITRNMGLNSYPWFGVSIEKILEQISVNESRAKQPNATNSAAVHQTTRRTKQ